MGTTAIVACRWVCRKQKAITVGAVARKPSRLSCGTRIGRIRNEGDKPAKQHEGRADHELEHASRRLSRRRDALVLEVMDHFGIAHGVDRRIEDPEGTLQQVECNRKSRGGSRWPQPTDDDDAEQHRHRQMDDGGAGREHAVAREVLPVSQHRPQRNAVQWRAICDKAGEEAERVTRRNAEQRRFGEFPKPLLPSARRPEALSHATQEERMRSPADRTGGPTGSRDRSSPEERPRSGRGRRGLALGR